MMKQMILASVALTASAFGTIEQISMRSLVPKLSPVFLETAGDYVILAQTGISTVPDSAITGDIAVSPISSLAITGFGLLMDSSGSFSTTTQVVGRAFAPDYTTPTPSKLLTAVLSMQAAYLDAAARPNADAARINLGGGTLGGAFGGPTTPLTPGVYTFGTGIGIALNLHIRGTGFGQGQGESDIFIIQSTGNLVQAANTRVILENGALAKNIIWQIAGYVQVGAGAHMEGTLLVKTNVVFITGSSLYGRVMAQTACDLQKATITQPAN